MNPHPPYPSPSPYPLPPGQHPQHPPQHPAQHSPHPQHHDYQQTAAAALSAPPPQQQQQHAQSSQPHIPTPNNTAAPNGRKRKAGQPGSRGVANLTPEQLAKKRANDREAQRAIRERTKNTIEGLEARIRELESQQPYQELQRALADRDRALQECEALRTRLAAVAGIVGNRDLGQTGLNGMNTPTNRALEALLTPDGTELAALTAQQSPCHPHRFIRLLPNILRSSLRRPSSTSRLLNSICTRIFARQTTLAQRTLPEAPPLTTRAPRARRGNGRLRLRHITITQLTASRMSSHDLHLRRRCSQASTTGSVSA